MKYVKTKIELAAERWGIDPKRFGDQHTYVFAPGAIPNNETRAVTDKSLGPCLLLALGGQTTAATAASYAGLELQFEYAGKFNFSDGRTIQWVPFGILFGGVEPNTLWEWDLPPFYEKQIDLTARIRNVSGGSLTPTVVCKTVEIR